MTNEEKYKIRLFALGKKELKDECVDIYIANLKVEDDSIMAEMGFMREVDHPCPDYMLKDLYRNMLFGLHSWEKLDEEAELNRIENEKA